MAGPGGSGGGGFGGGSFGGGSSGGSFGGGGFGGGSFGGFSGSPHHRPHHTGPVFFGPRRRTVGGGCFGGFAILLFIAFMGFYILMPSSTVITIGDENTISYDESVMQDYANEQYNKYFGASEGVEDNLLLVLLTNEAADGYYTIAWVGDNVKTQINELFGEYADYGYSLEGNIDDYYAYSLDTDLVCVIEEVTKSVVSLNLPSSFKKQSEKVTMPPSALVNHTSLELSEDIVNKALAEFTEQTGIPCVLIIDSAEKIFGTDDTQVGTETDAYPSASYTSFSKITVVLAVAVAVLVIAVIVLLIRSKNKAAKPKQEKENDQPWES